MTWRRKRAPAVPPRDRAGTYRVEVCFEGVTRIWVLGQNGAPDRYSEQPYQHWVLLAGYEGLSEVAARGFVKRHPRIDNGRRTRAISHEDHLAELAAETRRRRSESAKAAWRHRREQAARERAKAFPPLRSV